MKYWRQCALWLINCKVLPPTHRVTADSAQVFDLAQTLRDGVLLCQLLNNLKPHTINLKEINLRPQMSQFLCLKNIRTFLSSCCEVFGLKKTDLFEAFDLFDVRDFGKVTKTYLPSPTLSLALQWPHLKESVCVCVRACFCVSENILEDEEELYAPVYGFDDTDEGGEIYEDLMRTEQHPTLQNVRSCCLSEIKQTEERYTETLESIEKYFLNPLKKFFSAAEIDKVFINIPDLVKVHKSLMVEVQESILNKNALNLYQIFIAYKDRLLIYGIYCSHVEISITVLDFICKEKEDVRLKLKECSKRANNGKFTLRDLLVVPMQRVLKYHLLLQELVKHTPDAVDKNNLKMALDAMKDLAQYVNEVKRDKETLKEINQYQRSIENLNQPLESYGRPKGDGEVRMVSNVDKKKQDRHIFLFDGAVIVCKRRGDNYEMKDVIDLNYFKITNNPTQDRESKKWFYGFYLTHQQGQSGFEFFFKTKELKKKWLDQFDMAISNIRPENSSNNSHQFRMHTFIRITTCSSCHLLLRGIFNQGYLCLKCGLGAHKECLGRVGVSCVFSSVCPQVYHNPVSACVCSSPLYPGLPRMLVIRDYCGIPSPQSAPPLTIHAGDIIELICADLHSSWWQGKILATREIGFFPSDAVRPCPCVRPMERQEAAVKLMDRENSTYLIRHRTRESNEYAISIKFNDEVKHIKILTKNGCFYIAETRLFKTVLDLVDYYKQHSLREGFKSLDTTLQVPFREPGNGNNMPQVFSPRVVGIALARYDFSSRDTRELSLQEGDIVKIYTKMANGWWRGEVNGRVSLYLWWRGEVNGRVSLYIWWRGEVNGRVSLYLWWRGEVNGRVSLYLWWWERSTAG
uniref:Vav 3 guanine nucleotide exchange factor b n=1 Tax=Salmo trutta TaxID=8032 RepID=A0A674BK43_SALTR